MGGKVHWVYWVKSRKASVRIVDDLLMFIPGTSRRIGMMVPPEANFRYTSRPINQEVYRWKQPDHYTNEKSRGLPPEAIRSVRKFKVGWGIQIFALLVCYERIVVVNYQTTVRNIPEQRRSHLHRGGNLKSRKMRYCLHMSSYQDSLQFAHMHERSIMLKIL
jgi:hypothetical protein